MTPRLRSLVSSPILFSLCLLSASGSLAGIGLPYGEFSMAYTGSETLTLYVVPDGSGETFDRAFLPYGGFEDATLTLLLKDGADLPIANFPREDIWLESRDGGLLPCVAGTIADANTDAAGMTQWVNPLFAGGSSQALTDVIVNGGRLELATGVRLSFNSPDINGDLTVNLTDVQLFTADFYTAYDFRSDFHRDGTINLSDLAELAHTLGAACP